METLRKLAYSHSRIVEMKLDNPWKAYVKLGISWMKVVITRAMTMMMIMMMMMNSYIHRKKIWQRREEHDLTEGYAHRLWVGLISADTYDSAVKFYCSWKAQRPMSV